MRIRNESTLQKYRGPGRCECCGRWCESRAPHHVQTRGAGGSDIDTNLISLGFQAWTCQCHNAAHAGVLDRSEFERIIANREGIPVAWAREIQWLILRLPKDATEAEIAAEIAGRPKRFAALVRREIGES